MQSSVGVMAPRRLLHGHGGLPDLLAQRGQLSALVAQPEQPEQEACRQQNASREHGEQEDHHQLPPPRRRSRPVQFYLAPASASWPAATPPGGACSCLRHQLFEVDRLLERPASPSLTPCSALTRALRISASDSSPCACRCPRTRRGWLPLPPRSPVGERCVGESMALCRPAVPRSRPP